MILSRVVLLAQWIIVIAAMGHGTLSIFGGTTRPTSIL